MCTPDEYMDSFESFCDDTITINSETGKALKDVVGNQYEKHRYRIYRKMHLDPRSEIHDKSLKAFNADAWVYDQEDNLVIVEEAKGHYVDSCFLERALGSFAKQIKAFLDDGWTEKEIPYFIISSPTTYSLFDQKFEEYLSLYLDENPIKHLLREKVKYFCITSDGRLDRKSKQGRSGWLQSTNRPIPRTPLTESFVQQELNFLSELRGGR
jgi:hypothetical protein